MAYFRRRGALRAIFQHNAHLVETVARRIRRRPVFRFARVQTLLDERFDLRHFRVVNLRAALQERLRLLPSRPSTAASLRRWAAMAFAAAASSVFRRFTSRAISNSTE